MLKNNLRITLVASLLVLIVGVFLFKPGDVIRRIFFSYMHMEQDKHIGTTMDRDFRLTDAQGRQLSLTQRYPRGVWLMVYSRGCPACMSAMKEVELLNLKRLLDNTKPAIHFAAVEFAKIKDPALAGVDNVDYFRAEEKVALFDSNITPQFYRFDGHGVLKERHMGFEAKWLASIWHGAVMCDAKQASCEK